MRLGREILARDAARAAGLQGVSLLTLPLLYSNGESLRLMSDIGGKIPAKRNQSGRGKDTSAIMPCIQILVDRKADLIFHSHKSTLPGLSLPAELSPVSCAFF